MYKKVVFFIFGLILMSCSTQTQPKEVEVKYPKEYIIVVRYTDNVVDTISYSVRSDGEIYFTIKNVESQLVNRDVPIKPTLVVGFTYKGSWLVENVAVDIKSYKIIKEIY